MKKRPEANDQLGQVLVAVRMKLTVSLGPHRMGVSPAGSLKFICVAVAIRKASGEPRLCLTYYNLSSPEKPYSQRFVKSTR